MQTQLAHVSSTTRHCMSCVLHYQTLHVMCPPLPDTACPVSSTTRHCMSCVLHYQTLHVLCPPLPDTACPVSSTTRHCMSCVLHYQTLHVLCPPLPDTACPVSSTTRHCMSCVLHYQTLHVLCPPLPDTACPVSSTTRHCMSCVLHYQTLHVLCPHLHCHTTRHCMFSFAVYEPAFLLAAPPMGQYRSGGPRISATCVAYGSPRPSIRWTQNLQDIAQDNFTNIYTQNYVDEDGDILAVSTLEICTDMYIPGETSTSCTATNGIQADMEDQERVQSVSFVIDTRSKYLLLLESGECSFTALIPVQLPSTASLCVSLVILQSS